MCFKMNYGYPKLGQNSKKWHTIKPFKSKVDLVYIVDKVDFVLDEIWDLIESVSEEFFTYSYLKAKRLFKSRFSYLLFSYLLLFESKVYLFNCTTVGRTSD